VRLENASSQIHGAILIRALRPMGTLSYTSSLSQIPVLGTALYLQLRLVKYLAGQITTTEFIKGPKW
jgi:hypothetical protein